MNNPNYRETHLRSLAKALSWRVTATLTTALIAFFITGNFITALTIGGIEFVLKFFIYYGHERLWETLSFGRKTHSHVLSTETD
jgi:uncharacterized membrane protein